MPDAWQLYKPPTGAAGPGPADRAGARDVRAEPGDEAEAELWRRWHGSGDLAARRKIVELYVPYAHRLAARLYARRMHVGSELEDYRQFAMVGLLESVDRYVPGGTAHFRTYAMRRIQGAILNGLERWSERQQQIAAQRRIHRERAHSLAPESLAGADAIDRLLAELGEIGLGLALGFILEGTGMCVDPDAALVGDVYAHLEMRQLREQLWDLVVRLPDREREVVRLHYRDAKRFDDIADTMAITKGRVSQLHRQALVRLRNLIRKTEGCDVAY